MSCVAQGLDSTYTDAVLLSAPVVARTVASVPAPGAVYRPLLPRVPPPDISDQVNDGCAVRVRPNWSRPVAVNCRLAPGLTLVGVGVTVTLVSVWLTTMPTLEGLDRPARLVE